MSKITIDINMLCWGYFTAVNEGVIPDDIDLIDKIEKIEDVGLKDNGFEYDFAYNFNPKTVSVSVTKIE